ncbi:Hypothetical protein A7982_11340 [Minicystis rosea]|nr:Hypothetical protein A7982_11340 [Minicystis rosea]
MAAAIAVSPGKGLRALSLHGHRPRRARKRALDPWSLPYLEPPEPASASRRFGLGVNFSGQLLIRHLDSAPPRLESTGVGRGDDCMR